jgi:hypothetical protein
MEPISREWKGARDRRDVAIHETGHLVIARHIQEKTPVFGMKASGAARIGRVNGTTPGGREWKGDFEFVPLFDMPPWEWCLVGVAGVVAVTTWQRRWRGLSVQNVNWEDPETMSSSDWKWCGCDPGKPTHQLFDAAVKVSGLFDPDSGNLWREVYENAHTLMRCHVLSF